MSSPASSPSAAALVEVADLINRHLAHKKCPSFLGDIGKREKGFKLLAFPLSSIPLHVDKFPREYRPADKAAGGGSGNDGSTGEKGPRDRMSVDLCIVDAVKEGYCKVPIEAQGKGNPKPTDDAKPLSEMQPWTQNKQLSMMRCWPYTTVPNMPKEKDVRREQDVWELYPGMILRVSLWSDKARGSKKQSDMGKGLQSSCDRDEIPAFTLVVIQGECKGWSEPITVKGKLMESAVTKGYGISISHVDPIPEASLYSIVHKLPVALRSNLTDSRADNLSWQEKFLPIRNVIGAQGGAFYLQSVDRGAAIDIDDRHEVSMYPRQMCLRGWAGAPSSSSASSDAIESMYCIDILETDAMIATNTCTAEAACAIIEAAIHAGALSVVVSANEYRAGKENVRSILCGWPMIDADALLRCIKTPVSADGLTLDKTRNYVVFTANFEVPFPKMTDAGEFECDDGSDEQVEMLHPLVYLSRSVISPVNGSSPVKCPDFILCGQDVDLGRALFVRFVHPKFPDRCVMLNTYINLSRPQIAMPGKIVPVHFFVVRFFFCNPHALTLTLRRSGLQHFDRCDERCSPCSIRGGKEEAAMDAAGAHCRSFLWHGTRIRCLSSGGSGGAGRGRQCCFRATEWRQGGGKRNQEGQGVRQRKGRQQRRGRRRRGQQRE
jgi:hypothetical protein